MDTDGDMDNEDGGIDINEVQTCRSTAESDPQYVCLQFASWFVKQDDMGGGASDMLK